MINGDYNGEDNEQTSYWKVKLSKWPVPSCCPFITLLVLPCIKTTMFGNTHAASLQLTELPVDLYKLGIKVIVCFYFTQCPISSVPLPIINSTTHNNKNLSLFPSYIIYLNILLLSNFVLFSCLLCPARVISLVLVFLLLYN